MRWLKRKNKPEPDPIAPIAARVAEFERQHAARAGHAAAIAKLQVKHAETQLGTLLFAVDHVASVHGPGENRCGRRRISRRPEVEPRRVPRVALSKRLPL